MKCLTVTPVPLYDDPISPLIYGEFIEPINDLLPGMWAEKVEDRSFEGLRQPVVQWREDEDWTYPRWHTFVSGQPGGCWPADSEALNMVYPRVSFRVEQGEAFVGRQSALVRVEAGADKPFVAGVAQHGIAVRRGEKLRFEAYMRTGAKDADFPVRVLLGRNYGVFFKTYANLELRGVTGAWARFAGEMTSTVTDDNATLAIGLDRPAHVLLSKVSLMPADSLYGWRADVVAAIRALRPGIIRFGGSSLIYYQWQDGIGPRARRAPFENRPWGNTEENDVGLHEFLQFCELVDAQPLICVNSNSATIEQVLGELEYCNGPADSRWGRVRAEMGHPEPFRVRYVQIGNEQSGEAYEDVMVAMARAIRNRYPEITLLASYPSERLLRDISDAVDYVCPHYYRPHSPQVEDAVQQLIASVRQTAKNKNLKLAATEWNITAGHWGWARSWLLTLYDALHVARYLNMYQRYGDMFRIANRSNMTNSSCSGGVQTNRAGGLYLTPCYHVQRAYANLAGDRALRVVAGEGEMLDVAATLRSGDGEVALFVVNCSDAPQLRRVELAAASTDGGQVEVWMLTGAGPDAVNSFEEPACLAPKETTLLHQSAALDYTFSPYSVTILRTK